MGCAHKYVENVVVSAHGHEDVADLVVGAAPAAYTTADEKLSVVINEGQRKPISHITASAPLKGTGPSTR